MPVITLTTDFGPSLYVAQMKGAIASVCPEATVVDVAHDIPPQNVAAGAFALLSCVPYFHGAVHVGVVDPGVGTARAPVIVTCTHGTLVGPDNGLLAPAARALGLLSVHRITNSRYMLRDVSSTFHGRDIFAPVAAFLAKGLPPADLGVATDRWMDLSIAEHQDVDGGVAGHVVSIDRFGNAALTIAGAVVTERFSQGEVLDVSVRGTVHAMPLLRTYGLGVRGQLLATIGSSGFLEVALREGDAAAALGLHHGDRVVIRSRSGGR